MPYTYNQWSNIQHIDIIVSYDRSRIPLDTYWRTSEVEVESLTRSKAKLHFVIYINLFIHKLHRPELFRLPIYPFHTHSSLLAITTNGTMNFSTSYINDVNSRAVLLLQQNRHMDAICWLRSGLKNLASLEHLTYDAHQQNVYTHHASRKCVDSMDMDADGQERPVYSIKIPAARDTIMSDSPDNAFVVFYRAFHLSDYGELETSANPTIASATLLYNMGLAWQHIGIQETNTTALKKALFAYERAYSVLSQSQQQCNDSFSYLVMLALCNNMAHIHFHFFNLEKAKNCRDLIPQILACSSPGISSMATDDFVFFLSEAMLLKGQVLKFAPAA
jgi:hypothetical protein